MSPVDTNPPFEYTGGTLALDFANTVNGRFNERPRELLTDYSRMVEWAKGAHAIVPQSADRLERQAGETPGRAHTVLRHALRLREALHAIFSAVAEEREIPGEALGVLNAAIRDAARHACITHADGKFVWEWIDESNSLDSILWSVARAAGQLLTSDELVFVRRCGADTCRWLFLDKTKNHRRRWCEMKTCGNRDKARRYYHRQKA